MRTRIWPMSSVLAIGFIAGCTDGGGSDTPMATDGPNQVVIKVPGMT